MIQLRGQSPVARLIVGGIAVGVLLTAVLLVASIPSERGGGTAAPSIPATTPIAQPASPPAPPAGPTPPIVANQAPVVFPQNVLGLSVLSVPKYLAIARQLAGRTVAVSGWYAPVPPVPCPAWPGGIGSPIQIGCPAMFQWLLESPASPWTSPPTVRGFNPIVSAGVGGPGLDRDVSPSERDWAIRYRSFPVVLVGHTNDPRAAYCPGELRIACKEAFVVERVAWKQGELIGLSPYHDEFGPATSLTAIDAVAAALTDPSVALSIIPVSRAKASVFEPDLAGRTALAAESAVWLIHVLDDVSSPPEVGPTTGLVRRLMVGDKSREAYLIATEALIRLASPLNATWPREIDGLSTISVSTAINLRKRGSVGDQRLAIRGYYSAPALHPCPTAVFRNPLGEDCPFDSAVLMEYPERVNESDGSSHGPAGPFLSARGDLVIRLGLGPPGAPRLIISPSPTSDAAATPSLVRAIRYERADEPQPKANPGSA